LAAAGRRTFPPTTRRKQLARRNNQKMRSRYVPGSLLWCPACDDGSAELLVSNVRLLVSSLTWAAQSQRVCTRGSSRARRLRITDQGGGGRADDAGDAVIGGCDEDDGDVDDEH
jgi:hypothetical protein